MANETVLDVLKKVKSAKLGDIARHLRIETRDALNMLRECGDRGECVFHDGMWHLPESAGGPVLEMVPTPTPAPEPSAKQEHQTRKQAQTLALAANTPASGRGRDESSMSEEIIKALKQNGAMKTAAIASVVNRDPQGMAAVMTQMERRGLVAKSKKGEGCLWSLPPEQGSDPISLSKGRTNNSTNGANASASANANGEKASSRDGGSAGSVAGAGAGVGEVSLQALLSIIGKERRLTQRRMANLNKIHEALNTLSRHQGLVRQLSEAVHATK
ncbi:hypothetical protein CWG85_06530 [Salmonella enterica subsp. enterica serovar Adelaide]|nr:hypothetical protein [Salmonella enterica subsp. enterica serovar Kokomlemle]EDL5727701.1 hypothetical protein [Salmonella enterica subsp. enterica serovar Adelaide]